MFINGKHRLKSNDFFLVAYGSVRNVFVNPFMVGRPADYGLSNCARLPFLVRMTALPISKTNVFFSLAGGSLTASRHLKGGHTFVAKIYA